MLPYFPCNWTVIFASRPGLPTSPVRNSTSYWVGEDPVFKSKYGEMKTTLDFTKLLFRKTISVDRIDACGELIRREAHTRFVFYNLLLGSFSKIEMQWFLHLLGTRFNALNLTDIKSEAIAYEYWPIFFVGIFFFGKFFAPQFAKSKKKYKPPVRQ